MMNISRSQSASPVSPLYKNPTQKPYKNQAYFCSPGRKESNWKTNADKLKKRQLKDKLNEISRC